MRITTLGGAKEIGASCLLLEIEGKSILIDAGIRMNPPKEIGPKPLLDRIEKLDLILLTHAHMDHSGALPLVYQRFPQVNIHCTNSTFHLIELLLKDAVKIMESKFLEDQQEIPLYDQSLVEAMIDHTAHVPFDKTFKPFPDRDISITFHPAGHILGASFILIGSREGNVLVTGDFSITNQRTLRGAIKPDFHPDVVISEATYGERLHESRKGEERKLAFAVAEVINRRGTVLIPAFAVGRAQEVILILKAMQNSNTIPLFPMYVDGMVRSACDIYENLGHDLSSQLQNYVKNTQQPIFFDRQRQQVIKVSATSRKSIVDGDPCCIISSSGMLSGGPSPFYARKIAQGERNAILMTGYQDEESPGRKLLELERGQTIILEDTPTTINCEVAKYNLSAHADRNQIANMIKQLNPHSVVLVHGDETAIDNLASQLKDFKVIKPDNGMSFDPLTLAPGGEYKGGEVETISVASTPSRPPKSTISEVKVSKDTITQDDLPKLWEQLLELRERRGYTEPELARLWFGDGFSKAQRSQLSNLLRADMIYFDKGRMARQIIYTPRSRRKVDEYARLRKAALSIRVERGDVIVMKDENNALRVGICIEPPDEEGVFKAIVQKKRQDTWFKEVVRENTGIKLPLEPLIDINELKVYLHNKLLQKTTRILHQANPIDIWFKVEGESYNFEELVKLTFEEATPEQRLALALQMNGYNPYFERGESGEYILRSEEEVLEEAPHLEKELRVRKLDKGTKVKLEDGKVVTLTGEFFTKTFQYEDEEGNISTAKYSHFEEEI